MREAVGRHRARQHAAEPRARSGGPSARFFDAIVGGGLEPGFGAKQLAARIDLQIRRVVEGSAKVADRLRREVLYYVAISAPVAPSVQAVQKGFGLAGLDSVGRGAERGSASACSRSCARRASSSRAAKDMWLKVTLGPRRAACRS